MPNVENVLSVKQKVGLQNVLKSRKCFHLRRIGELVPKFQILVIVSQVLVLVCKPLRKTAIHPLQWHVNMDNLFIIYYLYYTTQYTTTSIVDASTFKTATAGKSNLQFFTIKCLL